MDVPLPRHDVDLAMECDAEAAPWPCERRARRVHRVCDGTESRWQPRDHIAVRHPHVELARKLVEETGGVVDGHRSASILARPGRCDLTAKIVREQLHAVADAEDGNNELVHARVGTRGALPIPRRRS